MNLFASDNFALLLTKLQQQVCDDRTDVWPAEQLKAMADAGVPVNVARKDQEPFHSTLAVVDGSTYPVEEAMRAVNELVPPGTWTGGAKLTLTKPQW